MMSSKPLAWIGASIAAGIVPTFQSLLTCDPAGSDVVPRSDEASARPDDGKPTPTAQAPEIDIHVSHLARRVW